MLRSQLRARHGLGLERVASVRLRRILVHGVQLMLLYFGPVGAVPAELVEASLTGASALEGLPVVMILLRLHLCVLLSTTLAQLAADGHARLVLRLSRAMVSGHARHNALLRVKHLLVGL